MHLFMDTRTTTTTKGGTLGETVTPRGCVPRWGTPPLVFQWVVEENKIPSTDQQVQVQPPGGYGTFFSP
ncbi:hypothetical protein TNCV_2607421 [Trichonephila clavipes]|uniref:Uncharacterized protein n=1 Tax=Trichonephila clavipes TaxID=2585209 RepID=A0A8X6RYL3_TRICX|nr:hypothetical protein TNCV_2607421 [Trichonephila clavipes]